MNPLIFPFIFSIIVLVPVGLLTLLGGERGGRLACQGKFPDSEGFRTILGSSCSCGLGYLMADATKFLGGSL